MRTMPRSSDVGSSVDRTVTAPASVVVVGPDGSGKSAIVAELVARLGGPDHVVHLHGRATNLPRASRADEAVVEPHRRPPYRGPFALAKLAWLFVDTLLTWRLTVPRALERGLDVVVERGWWDTVVDPRRYRVTDARLALRLARFVPRPDLHVVLDGPAEVFRARKTELPIEEIERQLRLWRRVLPDAPGVLRLDATHPVGDLVDEIVAALDAPGTLPGPPEAAPIGARRPVERWIGMPPGSATRWWLPRAPGRRTMEAMAIHHPVTWRAILKWQVARLAARAGLLRLLPASRPPDFHGFVERLTPPGASVAVGRSWRDTRGHILVLGPDDVPMSLIKVAEDPVGRAELAWEAEMAVRLGSRLGGGVSAPKVLERGDGFVSLEAVRWSPRWDAAQLPVDVAIALGRLYREGADEPGGPGFAHGDFTPWNLLRTTSGWSLIDWEHARIDAPPFFDLFRFVVQSSAFLGRPRPEAILAALRGDGPLGPAFIAYAEVAGVDLDAAPGHLATYLEADLAGLRAEGEEDVRGVRSLLLGELRAGGA